MCAYMGSGLVQSGSISGLPQRELKYEKQPRKLGAKLYQIGKRSAQARFPQASASNLA